MPFLETFLYSFISFLPFYLLLPRSIIALTPWPFSFNQELFQCMCHHDRAIYIEDALEEEKDGIITKAPVSVALGCR